MLLKSLGWQYCLNNFSVERFLGGFNLQSKFITTSSITKILLSKRFSFVVKDKFYRFLSSWINLNVRSTRMISFLYGFRWYRFILFSGLGYKRRIYKKFKVMFAYVGDRHWILYKFKRSSFVGPHRRRNFVFFSFTKGSFNKDYSFFSSLRAPYVYKMKGFLDARVRGRFLFVRRIKIRGVKTKLSKKQQLL